MNPSPQNRWLVVVYAATIFTSALLLFQVQPIISKCILPWFGGSPAVWTTSMLFFQTLLFAGYAYAHFSQQYFRPAWQAAAHFVLLAAAVLTLPYFIPRGIWKPVDGSYPVGRILLVLGASVGLPYFVLSTTGPLLQAWFSRAYPGRSPYRLYALSNAGSLLALLTYPFVVEPALALGVQAGVWQWGFGIFAALCAYGAYRAATAGQPAAAVDAVPSPVMELGELSRTGEGGTQHSLADSNPNPGSTELTEVRPVSNSSAAGAGNPYVAPQADSFVAHAAATPDDQVPGWGRRLLWIALPAFASLVLLATTNHVCLDITPVPFLWVVPLSLYLLTFIICFDHARWYVPRLFAAATLLLFIGAAGYVLHEYKLPRAEQHDSFVVQMSLSFAGLFCVCMLCHGELVRLKPHPRHLTMFYMMISAGGALGGLLVSLVAPLIFSGYGEWYIALLGGCLLAVAIVLGTDEEGWFRRYPQLFVPGLAILAGCMFFGASSAFDSGGKVFDVRRNFYGVLTVKADYDDIDGVRYDSKMLLNGRIQHGMQYDDPDLRLLPTTYYGHKSGVGRAIDYFGKQTETVRVGAIGLGTGTLAAYARRGDRFVFYELNPEVPKICGEYFTYLRDARKRMASEDQLEIVMGDARLSLERELATIGPRRFHVLVVDAFSGDAIPMHLLTREAGQIYLEHLEPGGVLAIHISNRYLDLAPVVHGLANELKLEAVEIANDREPAKGVFSSDWIVLSRNPEFLKSVKPFAKEKPSTAAPLLWTDDYSNLFRILKR